MKKKRTILIIIGIILIDLIVFFIKRDVSYEITYDSSEGKIYESFNKKLNMYYFSVDYEGKTYEVVANHKYLGKKKLINKVSIFTTGDIICVNFSGKLDLYPVCRNNNELVSYSIVDNKKDEFYKLKNVYNDSKEYNNIKINTLLNKKVLIYNHHGFDDINNQSQINIFDEEVYGDNYSFMVDNYILIPNYDEKYVFKTFNVIDLNTMKNYKFESEFEINYDFYYLGSHKGISYIVDRKENKEYSVNPKKRKIELISKNGVGKVWDNKWVEESIVRLSSNNYKFNDDSFVNYHIKDDTLYLTPFDKDNLKVSDKKISKIIKQDGLDVYYLCKNELYYYNPFYGEVLMINYSEFEFNNNLTIYIY